MTCQDSFHEVAFNISFWTRNISSARILFWRGVCFPSSLSSQLLQLTKCTVGSKIIRALETIRVKKLIPNALL